MLGMTGKSFSLPVEFVTLSGQYFKKWIEYLYN